MDFDHRVPKVLIKAALTHQKSIIEIEIFGGKNEGNAKKTAGGVCDRHDWCQKNPLAKMTTNKEIS